MTFETLNLNPSIFKALTACGYTKPTPIQQRSIPEILNGKDLIASAQTGTGKTAAFVLPALHHISNTKANGKSRVLILTPTRELANQITQATSKYGKFLRLNTASIVGGMPYKTQLKDLSRADIIVATPGRLLDHMESKNIDLSQIEMLILDEADRMLDMGFIDDVKNIVKKTKQDRQTLLFSATVDDKLLKSIGYLLKNPIRIDLSNEKIAPVTITQELYIVDDAAHKTRLLEAFITNNNVYKAIIFSGTKINADKLAKYLSKKGLATASLHGDMKQNMRNKTIEQLRANKIQFLVATDVAARGIDVADISHVINFDLPKFSEDYVHRIGRTGRAGKTGIAISFALPTDGNNIKRIERYTGQQLPIKAIEGLEPTKRLDFEAPKSKKRRRNRGSSNKPPARNGGNKNHRGNNASWKGKEKRSARPARGPKPIRSAKPKR